MCDVYSAITERSRKDGQEWARDVFKRVDGDEFRDLIGEKVPGVPTYTKPTWVLTYDECIMFLTFLPKKNSKKYIKFIARQFTRIRAGDQSLHAEIDGQAASDGPEATFARSGLGLPTQEVATAALEDILQKRKLLELQIETAESNKRATLETEKAAVENTKAAVENTRVALQNGRLADAKAGQFEEELRMQADALAIAREKQAIERAKLVVEREKQVIEREKQTIEREKQETRTSSFKHSTGVPLKICHVVTKVFKLPYNDRLNMWVGKLAAAKFRELYSQEPPRKNVGNGTTVAYTQNHRFLLEAAANECKGVYDVSGIPERF